MARFGGFAMYVRTELVHVHSEKVKVSQYNPFSGSGKVDILSSAN